MRFPVEVHEILAFQDVERLRGIVFACGHALTVLVRRRLCLDPGVFSTPQPAKRTSPATAATSGFRAYIVERRP